MNHKPKILFFDIEVSRDIVEGYGPKYEFKVVKTIRHQELMCFAYRWKGEKKIHYVSRNHAGGYDEMLQHLWNILDDADIVIAHNGNRFDVKMANRFFVHAGLGPVKPFKSVDTLQVARSTFKFQSNSLQDLCEYLSIGSKEKINYADLEHDFLNNPTPKIERLMERYNKQDIVLLELLYETFLPYIKNHPNLGDIAGLDGVCPKCMSPNILPYGSSPRRNGRVKAYRCEDCGGRCNENTVKKTGRIVNA